MTSFTALALELWPLIYTRALGLGRMALKAFEAEMLAVDLVTRVTVVIKLDIKLPGRFVVADFTARQSTELSRCFFAKAMIVLVTAQTGTTQSDKMPPGILLVTSSTGDLAVFSIEGKTGQSRMIEIFNLPVPLIVALRAVATTKFSTQTTLVMIFVTAKALLLGQTRKIIFDAARIPTRMTLTTSSSCMRTDEGITGLTLVIKACPLPASFVVTTTALFVPPLWWKTMRVISFVTADTTLIATTKIARFVAADGFASTSFGMTLSTLDLAMRTL